MPMSLLNQISQLVQDPVPEYVFEFSDAGVAFARRDETGFLPFEPGTLTVSPVENNLHHPEKISGLLSRIAPQNGSKKRARATLILPDYAARVTVLDFDSFPDSPEEQLSLIRFRLKKTLPFDIDSAAVSYFVQPSSDKNRIEVVAVIVALEVIAKYEALFRSLNFHAGEITTSALATLNLYNDKEAAVIAKLCGRVLTVMVVLDGTLKLFRCVELEQATEEQVLSVIQPTLVYAEDELSSPATKLILCGFTKDALTGVKRNLGTLYSKFGTPGAFNAGLLGYLEGSEN